MPPAPAAYSAKRRRKGPVGFMQAVKGRPTVPPTSTSMTPRQKIQAGLEADRKAGNTGRKKRPAKREQVVSCQKEATEMAVGNGGISQPTKLGTGVQFNTKGNPDTGAPMRTPNPPKKSTGKIGG